MINPDKIKKKRLIKRIFIFWWTFTPLHLYDKEYLRLLTSFTAVQ